MVNKNKLYRSIALIDTDVIGKAKQQWSPEVKEPEFLIGTDTNNQYCLMRKVNGNLEVILQKTIKSDADFLAEVENISKYFKAEIKDFY